MQLTSLVLAINTHETFILFQISGRFLLKSPPIQVIYHLKIFSRIRIKQPLKDL